MVVRLLSGGVEGVDAYPVELEVDCVRQGLPGFTMVGLAEAAVREAKDRVFAALRASGFRLPPARITVNLAPAWRRKNGASYDLPLAVGLLAAAGCVVCVNWGVYIWAVANGHMIDSSLAYYMNPILAILLGTVLFRERLTKLQWLAVAVTFAGLVITVIRYRQIPWIALVIGGSFAVYGALKKQVRSDAAVSTFVETLTLAPFALVLIFWMETHGTGAAGVLSGWQWLLLPVSGVVTTVPLMFFAAGMKTTPMTLSGILMYINPTMQLLLSVALYGEAFTATHAILFGFVWAGLILYLISGARESRRHREEEKPCV